ncbi:hypothetical protein Lsan_4028 [Legionella santicrucis]|uniref:Methyltransferase type 11 domain-containing protein n=1 Tax=Legionella santicrucis TaxID=45074 RepID=A0A0W0YA95_9GAMM|nr:hypothetical protein [Legionella santicrucis]KTD53618.1 hypothetical protein Lsan_4028 [Legionella santicrucis]
MKEKIDLSSTTNTTNGYVLVDDLIQTRNSGEIIHVQSVLDDTECLVAMDTLPFEENTRNLDVGGGKFDTATEHVKYFYKVENFVYDPYNRSVEHNEIVLNNVKQQPVDTVTSLSVLNVILDKQEREDHLNLVYHSLKPGGYAFFKVWRGNSTGIPSVTQSNKDARSYLQEVQNVFGEDNVSIPDDDIGNTIFAKRL